MTIVIVICGLGVVAFSAAFAIGLSRAAARGDEGMNDDLAFLAAQAREQGGPGAPPRHS
jgi:hypothetical protein